MPHLFGEFFRQLSLDRDRSRRFFGTTNADLSGIRYDFGSLSTIHANSAEQALTRFAHCVMTAGVNLPHTSVCEAISLAVNLIVHIARLNGRRFVAQLVSIERETSDKP